MCPPTVPQIPRLACLLNALLARRNERSALISFTWFRKGRKKGREGEGGGAVEQCKAAAAGAACHASRLRPTCALTERTRCRCSSSAWRPSGEGRTASGGCRWGDALGRWPWASASAFRRVEIRPGPPARSYCRARCTRQAATIPQSSGGNAPLTRRQVGWKQQLGGHQRGHHRPLRHAHIARQLAPACKGMIRVEGGA